MTVRLRPLPLHEHSGWIHTPPVPIHKNIFGESTSVRIQEKTPGKVSMYWFRGYTTMKV